MMQEKLPKKFIKRLFRRPHKAKCKKCGNKVFLLPEDENPGKILFRCVNSQCGEVIDVTEYKSRYSIDKSKLHKMAKPQNDTDMMLVWTRVYKRTKDKYYIIDDKTTYNPISRTKCVGKTIYTKVENEEHKKLLDIINNGQS